MASAAGSATTAARRRFTGLLPDGLRSYRPLRWYWEVALLALCLWVYNLIRNAAPEKVGVAMGHAEDVQRLQDRLHISFELSFNRFVADHALVAQVMNYYYATLHFVVTIAVLVWVFRVHPRRYSGIRTALFVTSMVALLGFWLYPLAPPRLAEMGYVDTLREFNTWGSFARPEVADNSNQYAAMPSLHTAWALWSGLCLVVLARRAWVRILGVLYAVVTVVVIVGTANHFILDAVAGAAVLGCGFAVPYLLFGRSAFREAPPRPDEEAAVLDIPGFERGEPAQHESVQHESAQHESAQHGEQAREQGSWSLETSR
ncbi:MAG: phosphatase PAP2 family protein [Micrococcales bacterium]|nr:phosphatase PAP2 family protein [Micrococcales bacterium]